MCDDKRIHFILFSEEDYEENGSTVEGDEVQMTQHIIDIDPITKQPLQNPCRNILCGHIYGMDSIKESLKQNSMLRCPTVGCNNHRYILIEDLEEDKELARKLYVQRAKANRRK